MRVPQGSILVRVHKTSFAVHDNLLEPWSDDRDMRENPRPDPFQNVVRDAGAAMNKFVPEFV